MTHRWLISAKVGTYMVAVLVFISILYLYPNMGVVGEMRSSLRDGNETEWNIPCGSHIC